MDKKIEVLMSGLPGKMATLVAEYVAKQDDMVLSHFALTGPEITQDLININGNNVSLMRPPGHEAVLRFCEDLIAVDFTQPDAAVRNAELYAEYNYPFVMGTTGGDRAKLEEIVRKSKISAVIAPNMAKQIVVLQAMMQYAAETFPDAFREYSLEIVESHQQGKADTSGTAKSMVGYFNALGIPFTKDQIVMVREPGEQLKMGVPEDALGGHSWHTYTLRSEDGTVLFEFRHNVDGRNIYAEGTLDAIRFLSRKRKERGRVYSMIDVLSEKK